MGSFVWSMHSPSSAMFKSIIYVCATYAFFSYLEQGGFIFECQVGSSVGPKRIRSCAEVTKDLAKINEHRSGFQPGNGWLASKITKTRARRMEMNTSVLDIVGIIRIVCDSPQQRIEVAQEYF